MTDAAEFLDQLRRDAAGDHKLAEELADTYYRIARLQGVDLSINTGEEDEATRNLHKALALTETFMRNVVSELDNAWRMTAGEIDAALTGETK